MAAAAVWGLVRSAQSENPGRFVLVDLDDGDGRLAAARTVLAAGEPQVVVRDGGVRVGRLAGLAPAGRPASRRSGTPWRLDSAAKGSLDDLVLAPCPEAEPLRAGQVRVAVRAAGLNFRDVLNALGMYPGEAGPARRRGRRRGHRGRPRGAGLVPGDRVMGMVAGGFGPVAVADERLVTRVPGDWSLGAGRVGAAGVPDRLLRPGGPRRRCGRASRSWSTRAPAVWAWPRSSWPAIWARRSSRRRARPSRTLCVSWVSPTTTSPPPVTRGSSGVSLRSRVAAAWTWC